MNKYLIICVHSWQTDNLTLRADVDRPDLTR